MKIDVNTKDNCPMCNKVKNHLDKIRYAYNEIKIDNSNIDKLLQFTRSAPVVFIDNEFMTNEQVLRMK